MRTRRITTCAFFDDPKAQVSEYCGLWHPAFTLIELLVVIGIIALLISILLPTLGRARDQANTVKCLANMRQIAIACHNYSSSNQGYVIPGQWGWTSSSPFSSDQALGGNDHWCTILVNEGYLQAPGGNTLGLTTIGPRTQSVFFCPSANGDLMDPTIINSTTTPSSRIDGAGAEPGRYYSSSTRISVDCSYGINGSLLGGDTRTGSPCRRCSGVSMDGRILDNRSLARMSQISHGSEMVYFFDGLFLDQTAFNANRINARHNRRSKTNLVFFDGHAVSQDTKDIPGGLGSAQLSDFFLANLQKNYPPPRYPMWLMEQQN
jgi:prepilin-type N-terminal cleavage/methylation domain-containing protein/prepilin-type processing-associated H-X9-DG protein